MAQTTTSLHTVLESDFEVYYDAIPMAETLRNRFVFKAKCMDKYYRLRTLPTGARWSMAVGQAVTSTIVDIDTPVTVTSLIDNILIAAHEGQEAEFTSAVALSVTRQRLWLRSTLLFKNQRTPYGV